MPSFQSVAKAEREKKLKAVLTFATTLIQRVEGSNDTTLVDDLQTHIRTLPLQASSTVFAKQEELDRLGTELWNLAIRLRRDETDVTIQSSDVTATQKRTLSLLRAFSFLLLDSAGGHDTKRRQRKNCIRLMKVALKAARVCIQGDDLATATKVLERAADYQDVLSQEGEDKRREEKELADDLRAQYFAVRTTLAWRQDRMDTAEHLFIKCKQLVTTLAPTTAEILADLLYEIGKGALAKRDYSLASRWLERAHDVFDGQDLDMLSPEVGQLRLSIMQATVQAYMKIKTPETQNKAWQMMKLMETDFGDKMGVLLLRLELLSETEKFDTTEFYNVLLRMIRTIVLNETNFKTIMHHIHKLNEKNNATAIKALNDLIDIRLFREENQQWIEKAIITQIWIGTSRNSSENALEKLQDRFDIVSQNLPTPISAPAAHAAQTLLWKCVELAVSQENHKMAEAWCHMCLHPIFDKAGVQNQAKVSRKIIQCAFTCRDYETARSAYARMTETGRDEPVTRYLMYKVALQSGDADFATECLDHICRSSAKDATLLYACVMEAQRAGNKRQAINALQRVLDKYEHGATTGVHLPALLRSTTRMLQSELINDGKIDIAILEQICKSFEAARDQAKASRTRPSTPAKELFTDVEFEWFSKNSYNLSLKHCAEMPPAHLTRLLDCCVEFIKLLKEKDISNTSNDLGLRLLFCEFLAACTWITLARAEDNIEQNAQQYLEVRKHSQNFRRAVSEIMNGLDESVKADIISKHFQVVKLELEASLKLRKWDELDELFDQCWVYRNPYHYETLADLTLVIHHCIVQAELDIKYQKKVLSVLQKIVNLVSRQPGSDMPRLSRWLRCLFSLSLPFDDESSLKCIDQVTHIAATKQSVILPLHSSAPIAILPYHYRPKIILCADGDTADLADKMTKETERYPRTELEWLATTAFNRAIDYYVHENDEKAKRWAEKAFVVAQWIDDAGETRDFLMKRFSILKFNKE
ncbi:meiosis protein SPO22/ZIP4 like-domain-containing protein [Bipolaris maydis]|nr:meiosis protein SPO22/ZIP4 like-domain-containing protein [Bipolaris maydis]KAJ6199558.1 meiosis protein SPO22/ZIP4 like-domain-containing protein [Bipolaris maydis]KAJ6205842.1 meiosis protein SPO22/ZIP4 like-domain-containing protein [Bipolaris maydis]